MRISTAEIGFELALGMLDGPAVRGRIGRVVDLHHQGLGQHLVHGHVNQVPSIALFVKKGRSESGKQVAQMADHLFATRNL